MADFDLERFVAAQEPVYRQVKIELGRGRKESHWMWFVFPQIAGLGSSPTARHYAMSGPGEARAFLDHPLLGKRLRDCTHLVLAHRNRAAEEIFGKVDAMKFGSSMSLFGEAIRAFYGGERDAATLQRLDAGRREES